MYLCTRLTQCLDLGVSLGGGGEGCLLKLLQGVTGHVPHHLWVQ